MRKAEYKTLTVEKYFRINYEKSASLQWKSTVSVHLCNVLK